LDDGGVYEDIDAINSDLNKIINFLNGLEESEKSIDAVVEFEDEPITKDIIKLGFL